MSRRSGEDAAVREGRARPSSTGLRGNHRSQVPEVPTGGPGPTPALTCSHFLRPPRGTAHPVPSTTTETSTSKRVIYLHTENKTSARGPRAGHRWSPPEEHGWLMHSQPASWASAGPVAGTCQGLPLGLLRVTGSSRRGMSLRQEPLSRKGKSPG